MATRENVLTPDYVWNDKLRRYQDVDTGRIVSNQQVRAALDAVILSAKQETRDLSKQLLDGKLTLVEWQEQMAFNLKMQALASAALAKGGWAQMTASDFGRVGAELKKQYAYLQRFALDIQNGKISFDGRILTRADLYTERARGTFEDVRREMARQAGFDRERRVLGIADHCPDCLDAAARGWQEIGTLPAIGDSVCRQHCHCRFEFSHSIEGAGF